MLKRNYLVVKIFLAMYLVHIYVEYMYLCVSWICTYVLVNISIHVLLVILGLKMTTSLYFSPILRSNKANWFHLKLLSVWSCFTIENELLHGTQTGFEDWYICIYIFIAERDDLVVYPFGSLFLERKWLCHEYSTFYLFCFCFSLEVTWYIHVFHLCYRGKQLQ